jgi:alkylhydroperoxidase/carboxymuconolactone decarboxylase family protein YurZ
MALSEEQQKAFGQFYKSARNNTVFDEKTTILLHLASAMAVGCGPCMEYYLSQKEEAGITEEEIGTVQAIVMTVSAGKIKMQVAEAQNCGGKGCDK